MPPPAKEVQLTKEKLDEFVSLKGFSACYSFLSQENKFALLFVCLKRKDPINREEQGKNTHIAHYYLYSSGRWEEATSIKYRPNLEQENLLLVQTKGGQSKRIKNSNEISNLKASGLNNKEWECQIQSSEVSDSLRNKKSFVCLLSDKTIKDSQSQTTKLKWRLQDFN